jgi:hypothetical protein
MLTFLVLLCVALFLGALLGAAWDRSITESFPWTARRVPVRVRAQVPDRGPGRFASRADGSISHLGDWTYAPWNDSQGVDSPRWFD